MMIFQNILFLECERYPESTNWQPDQLATRVTSMVRQLLQCIKDRKVLQYFNREVNLLQIRGHTDLETLQRETANIEAFLQDPAKYLLE